MALQNNLDISERLSQEWNAIQCRKNKSEEICQLRKQADPFIVAPGRCCRK